MTDAERQKQWREDNREYLKKYHRERYLKNKEKKIQYQKDYYLKNTDKVKEYQYNYYDRNKDLISNRCKEYVSKNIESTREFQSRYYQKNKEKILKRCSKWQKKNSEHLATYRKQYRDKNKEKINKAVSDRNKVDIQFKLSKALRGRLNIAIKNNYKSGSAVKDLGCSIDFLKKHLEDKFQKGMSWENYGKKGWHIDHIRPLSSFNLENREEFLEACNYENLQPLWAKDNLSKGSKLDWEKDTK